MTEPDLVPELLVVDLEESLAFWVDACGFRVVYDRPEDRFAYLARGAAHLMLDQIGVGRDWITGPLERPLGRGLNLQIAVPDVHALIVSLRRHGVDLFAEPEERWYRVADDRETGVRQVLVCDPDGYLVRFQSSLGHRCAPHGD